jgi:hypothetical protein
VNPIWYVFCVAFGVCVGVAPDSLLPVSPFARYVIAGGVMLALLLVIKALQSQPRTGLGVRHRIGNRRRRKNLA